VADQIGAGSAAAAPMRRQRIAMARDMAVGEGIPVWRQSEPRARAFRRAATAQLEMDDPGFQLVGDVVDDA